MQDEHGDFLSGAFSRRRRYVPSPERGQPSQQANIRRSPRELPPIRYSVVGTVMHRGQSWIAEQYDSSPVREEKIPYTPSAHRSSSKRPSRS